MKIGHVEGLFRYPVKSMKGEAVDEVALGWHGLEGDRRIGVRRIDDQRGFPWLTATRLPQLLLYSPVRNGKEADGLPTHVRTPGGEELGLFGEELAAEIGERHGDSVELMHLDRGIFDEAAVSLIADVTIREIAELAGQGADVRRFRPNVLISSDDLTPFGEDSWVGGVITFGEGDDAASIAVTNRDERCSMVNYDPDSAATTPEVQKVVVRESDNNAGIYGTVVRRGRLAVGQTLYFKPNE